jgi:hypothetical protein
MTHNDDYEVWSRNSFAIHVKICIVIQMSDLDVSFTAVLPLFSYPSILNNFIRTILTSFQLHSSSSSSTSSCSSFCFVLMNFGFIRSAAVSHAKHRRSSCNVPLSRKRHFRPLCPCHKFLTLSFVEHLNRFSQDHLTTLDHLLIDYKRRAIKPRHNQLDRNSC